MKSATLTYATAIAALLIVMPVGSTALAQMNGPGGQVTDHRGEMLRGQLDAVSRSWRQAWDRNREVKNQQARALLDQARELLNDAGVSLSESATDAVEPSSLMQADVRIRAAEQLIRRALSLMGAGAGSGGSTQTPRAAIDEAENILHHVGRVSGGGAQYEQVELMIDQAREADAKGNSEIAARLAERAQERGRYLLHEAMRNRAMGQRADALDVVVESLVDRAERLAADSGDASMVSLAERAREHLRLAQQMQDESQAPNRSRLLAATMREAETVIRTLDREGFDQRRAEQSIADAEAALERARDAADGDDTAVNTQLTQGDELLADAREHLADGDVDVARRLANQAREIARRTIQEALGPVSAESVADAIARTDDLIEQARSGAGGNDRAEQLLTVARQRQEEAQRLLAQEDYRQALAQTRVAARLAERARRMSE